MIETLGLALLATVLTFLTITFIVACVLAVAYTYEHWDEYEDTAKFLFLMLFVFVFWALIFSGLKYNNSLSQKAEVEDVRTS